MNRRRMFGTAIALAMASFALGAAPDATLAQDYGSTVNVGGGVSSVANGDVTAVAPNVIISGGDVSNATGIGVDAGGGSSIGATTGGDDSAAAVQ